MRLYSLCILYGFKLQTKQDTEHAYNWRIKVSMCDLIYISKKVSSQRTGSRQVQLPEGSALRRHFLIAFGCGSSYR